MRAQRGQHLYARDKPVKPVLSSFRTAKINNKREAIVENEFDYLIIGGGSAGCALAGRLSEDPDTRVCLLEAGGQGDGLLVNVPSGAVAMLSKLSLIHI